MNNPVLQYLTGYERESFAGLDLPDILSWISLPHTSEGFPVSGLVDLKEVMYIVADAWRTYPILLWREMERDLPGGGKAIWGEGSPAGRKFVAGHRMATGVRQMRREFRRGGQGEESTQPATFHLQVMECWIKAWAPKTGDQVRYRNVLYEVLSVSVDPEHYWQSTGIPLYLTCEMGIVVTDSRYAGNCGGADPRLEGGAPSAFQPPALYPSQGEPL